jgi:hypothetical protein
VRFALFSEYTDFADNDDCADRAFGLVSRTPVCRRFCSSGWIDFADSADYADCVYGFASGHPDLLLRCRNGSTIVLFSQCVDKQRCTQSARFFGYIHIADQADYKGCACGIEGVPDLPPCRSQSCKIAVFSMR